MSHPASSGGGASLPVHPILVLKVPKATPVYVRFLGPLRQLGTHRQGKVPLVCWGPEDCPATRHKLPYRSKWYAPAQLYLTDDQVWRRVVVEVTESLERTLRAEVLRGQVWCLLRRPNEKLSKEVHGSRVETIPGERLPEPFDVDPCLKRLYGEMDLPKPLSNLMLERPVSEDEYAPPPKCLATKVASREAPTHEGPTPEQREQLGRLAGKIGAPVESERPLPPRPSNPALPVPSTNGRNGTH